MNVWTNCLINCTNNYMKSLTYMLGGSARFDLLRALYFQYDAVGLRQLARLAGVHPHSAERMLKDLVKEGVVARNQAGARTLFRRNDRHVDWRILSPVFDAADRAARSLHAAELSGRARIILPFIEEAGVMLSKARRRVRVA